jgi:urease subunit gamma/beta
LHLTPREHERLLLAAAADLARRRLARGAPLGATEAVALVCDEVCELAWDGVPLEEVIDRARAVIPPAALLPGVAGLVPVIEVEALFPWGSTLVHVAAPFSQDQERDQEQGDPERLRLPAAAPGSPGAVRPGAGVIELAAGAERRAARLRNTGPRDVWVSSHFPLAQVNPAVELRWAGEEETAPVRADVLGTGTAAAATAASSAWWPWRLDLPAGEALLLRAGQEREVTVVARHG